MLCHVKGVSCAKEGNTFFYKEVSYQRKQEPDKFAKWNEYAREILNLSEKEAIRLKQPAIGCEHLLLGILSQEDSVAMRALQCFDVDLVKAREWLEQKIGIGQALSPEGNNSCKKPGRMVYSLEQMLFFSLEKRSAMGSEKQPSHQDAVKLTPAAQEA